MTWKPMLFSTDMVRAIREGRKTQTRRVVKNPDHYACLTGDCPHDKQSQCAEAMAFFSPHPPGSGIWVKENYYYDLLDGPPGDMDSLYYIADAHSKNWCCELIPECQCAEVGKPKIRSGRFMPRWAARTFLEVESVKVERLQSISEEDAKAEGAGTAIWRTDVPGRAGPLLSAPCYYAGFGILWDSINAKKHPWSSNPWCWAYTFRPLTLAEATGKGWRA